MVNLLFLTTVQSLEMTPRSRTKFLLTVTKDTSYMGQLKDVVKRMVLGVAFRPLAKVTFLLLKNLSLITCDKKILEREDKKKLITLQHFFLLILSAVDCGPLSSPKNGSSSGESTVFPNSIMFDCDQGFLLEGPYSRSCQPNGTWSSSPASCVGMLNKS